MDNTIKQLEKLYSDARLGKNKHFFAADRLETWHLSFGIASVIINLLLLSAFLLMLTTKFGDIIQYIGALLALVSVTISGVQTFRGGFQQLATGHRSVGNRYLAVARKSRLLIARAHDNLITDAKVAWHLDRLVSEYTKIIIEAEPFSTNSRDYQRSQAKISSESAASFHVDELCGKRAAT